MISFGIAQLTWNAFSFDFRCSLLAVKAHFWLQNLSETLLWLNELFKKLSFDFRCSILTFIVLFLIQNFSFALKSFLMASDALFSFSETLILPKKLSLDFQCCLLTLTSHPFYWLQLFSFDWLNSLLIFKSSFLAVEALFWL